MRFHITDHSGHSTLEFDKTAHGMKEAEAKFNELMKMGYRATVPNTDPNKGPDAPPHVMLPSGEQKFDAERDESTFIRPIQGG